MRVVSIDVTVSSPPTWPGGRAAAESFDGHAIQLDGDLREHDPHGVGCSGADIDRDSGGRVADVPDEQSHAAGRDACEHECAALVREARASQGHQRHHAIGKGRARFLGDDGAGYRAGGIGRGRLRSGAPNGDRQTGRHEVRHASHSLRSCLQPLASRHAELPHGA